MISDRSIYFQLPKVNREGFFVQYDDLAHFYDQLHHHPELQLVYIIEGSGDLFVGDQISHFVPGNLFLIGSNQSHLFKSDPLYFTPKCQKHSRSISVFFHMKSLGDGFFDIIETTNIKNLINRSSRGIRFSSSIAHQIAPQMIALINRSDFSRFLKILSILHQLAETTDYEYLASAGRDNPPTYRESQKINAIINFILNNYKRDIQLDEVAKVANYSKATFCRFFRQRTRKTFTRFLNEVRIANARRLLLKTDLNVSQICYESGFNNVSNFNRQFKRITGLTPKAYLKKYENSQDEMTHVS